MLQVKELKKQYHKRPVLNGVSFCLPAGVGLGICGDNGSGKSTLLRILAQAEKPDSGDILFGGTSILADKAFVRGNVGYVPQTADLMPELKVSQQLKLWMAACGKTGEVPGEIIELLGLETMMSVRAGELSGGMGQRVSIAMALSTQPKILIMDEVTAGLDHGYCSRLLDWLEGYMKKGGRIIWCSHHAHEVERLCGSCIHLGQQLQQAETPV